MHKNQNLETTYVSNKRKMKKINKYYLPKKKEQTTNTHNMNNSPKYCAEEKKLYTKSNDCIYRALEQAKLIYSGIKSKWLLPLGSRSESKRDFLRLR